MPSLPRSVVRLNGYFQPQGSRAARIRPASSRGGSSHDDEYEHEERAVGAAFECHLAVVRAILGELSPGRCDGAPRGLEVYSRDRDRTTTCGTFALGLGTRPEDARGPVWHAPKIGESCRRGWSHFGVTQSHDTASFWPKRSGISTAAALRHRSETETNEQRCCRLKSCCIQFCMALRRSIRCDRRC